MLRKMNLALAAAALLMWSPAIAQGPGGKSKDKAAQAPGKTKGPQAGGKAKAEPGGKAKAEPGGKAKAAEAKGEAGGDHGKAGGDHGKAGEQGQGADKGEAGGDHGKAGGDHGKAGEHGRGAEMGKAGGEHGKAGMAHGKAGMDAKAKALSKHIDRMARIDRLAALAKKNDNAALTEKAEMLRDKETKRHAAAMARIGAKAEGDE